MGNSNIAVPEGIYALANPSSGITALNLNGECNLFGRKTYFNMTSFETFAIIDDAPVEKEVVKEKEGSWWGNLITGIVATVALAACAVAVVATGGAALGAVMLAGAAIGAGIVTASVAITDAKSGQARSWTQFLGDLVTGGAMGAVAGATIYGLWTALPIVGEAIGLQMSMWIGTSTFTAITIPKIGLGLGYTLMGLEGIRGLNEISSIGSGQDWILEKIFGGNVEEYTTIVMILDLLSMGYVQIGMDNIGLAKNKNDSEANIKEKAGLKSSYKENCEAEIPMTGDEWEAYFKEKYGEENVIREISKQETVDIPPVQKYKGIPIEEIDEKVLEQIYPDENAVYGYSPKKGTAYESQDFTDVEKVNKNREIRIEYLKQSEKIQKEIDTMIENGASKEEIAIKVTEMRNQDKVTARAKMSPADVEALETRNIEKYGNKVGPDAQWLFNKKKNDLISKGIEMSDEEIWDLVIQGAMRKDEVINTLLGIKH